MDSGIASAFLRKLRGVPNQDVGSAGQMTAPTNMTPGLDQAYSQPMNPITSAVQAPSMFAPNQALESQAVAQGNNPMHPLVAQIIKHFGLLNLIRNQANQNYVDPGSAY